MRIDSSSVSGSTYSGGAGTNVSAQNDPVIRSIKKQIKDANKKMQELASDNSIEPEEKMKKRQELQKEISDLNNKLRQSQIELRKKQREEKKERENQNTYISENETDIGLSKSGMKAMISADSSIKQADVHKSVASKLEGRAHVIESEIKQDGGKGRSTYSKEAELADINIKAQNATEAQAAELDKANKQAKETDKTDRKDYSEDSDNQDKKDKEKNEIDIYL